MTCANRLMTMKRTMGFKLETTPGTAETLAAADYDFSVYNVEYAPEIESYMRKLARGHYSRDESIAGRRKFTCTCSVDLHSGSALATPPQYFQMLRACGLKQEVFGATGVSLKTDSTYDNVPATIEIVEKEEGTTPKQLVVRGKGCMGNAKIGFDQVGQPVRIDFEFTGALDTITTRAFGSLIAPTAFDTDLPDAVLAATINLFATIQYVDKMSIDLGNVVSLFSNPNDPTGYCYARVTDRHPILELDPDMLVTDNIDWYGSNITNETGALSVTIGDGLVFIAPKAQPVQTYSPSDQDGRVKNNLRLELKGSINGDDEFELLQGSKS